MNKPLLLTAVILLAFIVFGLVGMDHNSPDEAADEAESPLQSDFDYYLNDMVLDRFAPDGTHNYRLGAKRVTHFPEGDISLLDSPALNWHQPSGSTWVLTAETGSMRPDLKRNEDSLLLEKNVVAQRINSAGELLDIKTESLVVFPDSNEASTKVAVAFNSKTTHLNSIGMNAYMDKDLVQLLSEVRGYHE